MTLSFMIMLVDHAHPLPAGCPSRDPSMPRSQCVQNTHGLSYRVSITRVLALPPRPIITSIVVTTDYTISTRLILLLKLLPIPPSWPFFFITPASPSWRFNKKKNAVVSAVETEPPAPTAHSSSMNKSERKKRELNRHRM